MFFIFNSRCQKVNVIVEKRAKTVKPHKKKEKYNCSFNKSQMKWILNLEQKKHKTKRNKTNWLGKRDGFNFYLRAKGISDSNVIRPHNHLVHKRTLNHVAKLAKWLSFVVSTYLYGAFDSMLLSCHVRVSERIHTL